MMIAMVFGMTVLGSILVPMGFQFLSVVAGKALLLAKMALLLSSINGLKKVIVSTMLYWLWLSLFIFHINVNSLFFEVTLYGLACI